VVAERAERREEPHVVVGLVVEEHVAQLFGSCSHVAELDQFVVHPVGERGARNPGVFRGDRQRRPDPTTQM
jgi:hypothetical protein